MLPSVCVTVLTMFAARSRTQPLKQCTCLRAAAFSFGLATTLAVLGIASSLLGRTYGQFGDGLPIAVGIVAVIMGLNLLELLPLALPSLDVDVRQLAAPPLVQVSSISPPQALPSEGPCQSLNFLCLSVVDLCVWYPGSAAVCMW